MLLGDYLAGKEEPPKPKSLTKIDNHAIALEDIVALKFLG